MTTWRRISDSLLSVFFALAIGALCFAVLNSPSHPKAWLYALDFTFFVGLPFCGAGWLVSLPMVLMVRRTKGWRFWVLLCAGSCIGPVIMVFSALYRAHQRGRLSGVNLRNLVSAQHSLIYLAAGVSFLTTLFYFFFCVERNEPSDVNESAS
jgi:phosphatidylserine synthase